ncbi:MAG TPA: hypothetical protein PLN42_13130, partial [Anaerolineae bacterium]|nr:hypothetical protein [Anaerolineae bacterium]
MIGTAGQTENARVFLDTGPHQVGEQALDKWPAFLIGQQLEEFLRSDQRFHGVVAGNRANLLEG